MFRISLWRLSCFTECVHFTLTSSSDLWRRFTSGLSAFVPLEIQEVDINPYWILNHLNVKLSACSFLFRIYSTSLLFVSRSFVLHLKSHYEDYPITESVVKARRRKRLTTYNCAPEPPSLSTPVPKHVNISGLATTWTWKLCNYPFAILLSFCLVI